MDLPARAAYDLPVRRCRWARSRTYKESLRCMYARSEYNILDLDLLCISPSTVIHYLYRLL